jgi:hypothetical protein
METQKKSLASKLAAIMGDIDHVEKRGTNKEQGYKFVRSADVANICRKKLADEHIAVIANEVERIDGDFQTLKGTIMHTVKLRIEYTLIDGDSGERVVFHGWGDAFDTSDKAVNKCKTAALKYALRNLFLIPDESDPEADDAVDAPANQRSADPAPAQPPQKSTVTESGNQISFKLAEWNEMDGQYGPILVLKWWGKQGLEEKRLFKNTKNAAYFEHLKDLTGNTLTFSTEKKGNYTNLKDLVAVDGVPYIKPNGTPPIAPKDPTHITNEDIPF